MWKILITLGVAIVALLAVRHVRARRRDARISELNRHPERLEQMLDPSDDA